MRTIIIADDHQIFRESLSELLTNKGFKIIGTVANGVELLNLLDQLKQTPDIIIMDIAMPELDGYQTSLKVLKKNRDLKILTLSSFGDEKYYSKMIKAGVKGFVLKNAGIHELKEAIDKIISGGNWFSNELLQKAIIYLNKKQINKEKIQLTQREFEILQLICSGFSTQKIADKLRLSTETIRTYRAALLTKTQCNNAPALVMYAIKNKLIEV